MNPRRDLVKLLKAFGTWEKPQLHRCSRGYRRLKPVIYYNGYAHRWAEVQLTIQSGPVVEESGDALRRFIERTPHILFRGTTIQGQRLVAVNPQVRYVSRKAYRSRLYVTSEI